MSVWFSHAWRAALCAVVVGTPTCAFAQEDQANVRMLEMSERAEAAFNAGEHERAAQLFAEAYRISPDRVLIKNEMIAWYKAKRCDEALRTGDEFLRRTPVNPKEEVDRLDRRDAMTVVAKCQIEFAQAAIERDELEEASARLEKAEAQSPLPDDKAAVAMLRARIQTRRAELAVKEEGEVPDTDDPPEPVELSTAPERLGVLGYTAIGLLTGSAVLAGYGLTEALVGLPKQRRLRDTYEDVRDAEQYSCQNVDSSLEGVTERDCRELVDELRGHATRSSTGYAAGGVLAGAGAILLIIDLARGGSQVASTRPTVLPVVTGSSAGAMMIWRF